MLSNIVSSIPFVLNHLTNLHINPDFSSSWIKTADPFNPNRSLDFGEIARLCHAACFSPSRRRSGLRRGVARIRMRTEAGKMPESLTFPIKNGLGVSNDRFGFNPNRPSDFGEIIRLCHAGCGQKRARCPEASFSQSEKAPACDDRFGVNG